MEIRREQLKQMWDALKLCDEYFTACAAAWAESDGKLMDSDGRAIANAEGLDGLCNKAAEAVAALVHPPQEVW